MPTKTSHGVTLWAVPRFHRSAMAEATETAQTKETGVEWVQRLKTYSFPLSPDNEVPLAPGSGQPDQAETCH